MSSFEISVVVVSVVVVVGLGATLLVRNGKAKDSKIEPRVGGRGKQRTP